MTREEAKKYILQSATDYLQPDRSQKGFICPICKSGTGKNGTGITTKDGIHFTCWVGCFTNADIIDIIGLKNGLTDFNSKLYAAASEFNITIDDNKNRRCTKLIEAEHEQDYTDFFSHAAKNINLTDYHRGLSQNTITRFKLGYVKNWTHPKAPNAPASPRLIIPTSKNSYLARDIRNNLTGEQKKYCKSKVGKIKIFNSQAIKNARKPIFIVEGELDALSIIDVGGEVVALGSTANRKIFLDMLQKQKPAQPFIIALDNDKAGEKTSTELENGLAQLKISFYKFDIAAPFKDANESLMADRKKFKDAVAKAENMQNDAMKAEKEKLKHESVLYSLPDFLKNIRSRQNNFVPTGFGSVDKILDGGLYSGLYIVGAISSLGKTTFCLQIADQIANCGYDVIIFSLEMAKDELIAKSLSRLTFLKCMVQNKNFANAKTTRAILMGNRYENYVPNEVELIESCVLDYQRYSANIYIIEGVGNVDVNQIRDRVQKHIRLTEKLPVILIDYLQIISPTDFKSTDKQNTDRAVLELKRLSRDYSVPIVGISSFNRDNYISPVNLSSFKESGAIEYSSDVLIGLQYEGMDYQEGEADKSREKRIRELVKQMACNSKNGMTQKIQVKILKNRNGSKGDVTLDFYPMFNYFSEKNLVAEDNNGGWRKISSSYK